MTSIRKDILELEDKNSAPLRILKIFRREISDSSDYYIGLFFLSLFNDGVRSGATISRKSDLIDLLYNEVKSERIKTYSDLYLTFNSYINRLEIESIIGIFKAFNNLNQESLSVFFPEIFDNLLTRIVQMQGRLDSELTQPVELTRFVLELFALPKKAKIFNPFAGLASFGVFLKNDQQYYGQELVERIWAIGMLRLMVHNKLDSSHYQLKDSVLSWPDNTQKFDLIISNTPFGRRFDKKYRDIVPHIRSVEQFFIEKGIPSLSKEGKLIALTSQNFLFSGGYGQEQREFLIDNDLLDTIISIPGGILQNTNMPIIILVINKSKKQPGMVRFVRADKFVEARKPREKVLNVYGLNALINGLRKDEDSLKIVDNEQIKACDYNLNVPRYFRKEITLSNNEQLVKLKDILEYVRGQRGSLPKNGKLIRMRNLREDKVHFRLNVSEIEDVELRRPDIHQINETCLFLAIRWRTLKPTHFVFEGTPIYRSQDILSFKVNESVADYEYVINELHADYVQEQLESYRIGATIPFIRKDDLLEVVIKLPSFDRQQSLEIQRAKIAGIKEISDKIKNLEDERNAIAHGVSKKLHESVSTIKHSLGKPLLNIGSSLRNIENVLSRLNADWERVKLNERYDLTIKDSFNSIYSNLALIHSMLRNNESVLDVSNYELIEIDFLAFIKMYVNRIKSAERSNVSIKLDIHPDIEIQLKKKVLILANAELLEIGLNAIVENANMHAFSDDSKKYKLDFRVSLYFAPSVKQQTDYTSGRFNTYIKVEVANNGKPFPKNYSLEKLIRKNSFAGETGNTGQGGFDLNEIIKYHNNGVSTLELITDDFTTEFTTTYSFLIPYNR